MNSQVVRRNFKLGFCTLAATSWVLNGEIDFDLKLGFRFRVLLIEHNMLGSELLIFDIEDCKNDVVCDVVDMDAF